MTLDIHDRRPLHWQSQLVLLLTVPLTGVFVLLESIQLLAVSPAIFAQALAIGVVFALLVWILRAATPAAAFTGGLFTVSLYPWTPGWRTALWPLLALFLLTFAATRFGRSRKERLGKAEGKRGRTASQVAANLGVAVIAGIPLSAWHVWLAFIRVELPSSPPSPRSPKPRPIRFPPSSARFWAASRACSPRSVAFPWEPMEPSASVARSLEPQGQPLSPASPRSSFISRSANPQSHSPEASLVSLSTACLEPASSDAAGSTTMR